MYVCVCVIYRKYIEMQCPRNPSYICFRHAYHKCALQGENLKRKSCDDSRIEKMERREKKEKRFIYYALHSYRSKVTKS